MQVETKFDKLSKLLILIPETSSRSVGATELKIRSKYLGRLMVSGDFDERVHHALCEAISNISENGLGVNSHMVADFILACARSYPRSKASILDALCFYRNAPKNILIGLGEGIAIGLLEVFLEDRDTAFGDAMFHHFREGQILEAMARSPWTSAGSGRLSNAIHNLAGAYLWRKDDEGINELRLKIISTLAIWKDKIPKLTPANGIYYNGLPNTFILPKKGKQEYFLEKFADELLRRLFIDAPLGVKFELIARVG